MSGPDAQLTLVTLGVADFARSVAFYEALGFRRKATKAEGVGFFQAGAVIIAVWPANELAKDANVGAAEVAAFRGVALAWNCRSVNEVDARLNVRAWLAPPCRKRRSGRSGAATPAISPIPTGISGKSRTTRAFP